MEVIDTLRQFEKDIVVVATETQNTDYGESILKEINSAREVAFVLFQVDDY